ncbi:NAD-glutamate dehydrogenase [Spartinivicinus poritis]|uniref:NAD-glutamate dehydrogenase n=1 Tax=Spartinivicinus poritis TaxID=2994640 RepID=A0ABT5UAL2_9GAMM|nr:NAD-glutamate dehydrogenase [Spartinivicinus sp. A2-2]MDE1463405.1 NAD-glutamate dehydrogenase [Spartinivicinus sp. A2-2]
MGYISADNKTDYLKKLVADVVTHVPANQVDAVTAFTHQFFSIAGFEDLLKFRKSDIVGGTLSFWKFIQQHNPEQPKITIINPDYEHFGWHSTHTVIQIIHQDLPFLVDSIRMRLNRRGTTIHYLQNTVLNSVRDESFKLILQSDQQGSTVKEAVMYLEIDRLEHQRELDELTDELNGVLSDVRLAVADHHAICDKVAVLTDQLASSHPADQVEEEQAFLNWLLSNNFTFLGYEEIEVKGKGKSKKPVAVASSALGLLKSKRVAAHIDCDFLSNKDIISFSKSGLRSSVHRPAYPDYIAVKQFDKAGEVVGEARIMGLYTSPVYSESPRLIPILRQKVQAVIDRSGVEPSSHHGKELAQILEVFPREELFQMQFNQLFETAMGILQIQERRQIRVFIRQDKNCLFYSCLVYVPRDVYSTQLRMKMQAILEQRLGTVDSEFTTYFSESVLARVHFTLRLNPENVLDYNLQTITNEIIQAAYSWEDEFKDTLLEAKGEVEGNHLANLYCSGFQAGYRETFSPRTAVVDVEHCESLSDSHPLTMSFYQSIDDVDNRLRFKVFHQHQPLPLSDLIPIIENLGLRVIGEYPYTVRKSTGESIWIHDFTLLYGQNQPINVQQVNTIFQDAFQHIWFGQAENDGFNRLILGAQLSWRQVSVLRAYARYLKQIRFGLSQPYIEQTLTENIEIARLLVELFEVRFNPELQLGNGQRKEHQQALEHSIYAALDQVSVLNQDRTIRRYVDVINATLRTNFFQPDASGQLKDYISLKFSPTQIPQIPLPCPMFEIFVYSPRVEGVHLRGGKVARGGLRWSDRLEDFRTEVLGLVKAQQVKNAVIVPVGAKGGFAPKRLPTDSREAMLEEGIACYKTFIRALLDVTDNLQEGKVIPPASVVRYDGDDPYLVVAADKGTATFSDIANQLAEEYGFWLGDAFASGGSVGYDHKKMGITARGAWVSVQRHFREKGIDIQKDTISVVGVGDMAGDVFGNGMLLSESLAVVAAFNHMHIFIDPNPLISQSFKERQRLFNLPRSSWMDYDQSLISAGGGVFSRDAKSIKISPEMKERFAIDEDQLTPNELITALLKSPVDLIWNGGIGTYVKAATESHADVGDRANDALRINGKELRCQVVGEGGNLGLTQLGRVEYCLSQGASNTDFIDNAGGVDCSDHEVNIKILLNEVVSNGDMTLKQRNQLLEAMTDDVADLVLMNNYRQVQAISLAQQEATQVMDENKRFIHYLEAQGKLNRAIEFLPDDDGLAERVANNQGLTRPELSLLISYSKADLKEALLASDVLADAYFAREVNTAFPPVLVEKFGQAIESHRLRKEIAATQIANNLINMMGITFVHRLQLSTGAEPADIAKAFVVARDIFAINDCWQQIEALDHKVPSSIQQEMMADLIRLTRRATRWLIRMKRKELNAEECVAHYGQQIREFSQLLPGLLGNGMRQVWQAKTQELVEKGVPEDLAGFVGGYKYLSYGLSIVKAADQTGQPLAKVAQTYFAIGERLHLHWFAQELGNLEVFNHWQSMARESIRDELTWQQRALTVAVLNMETAVENIAERIEQWINQHQVLVGRWDAMLADLRGQTNCELAMFTVANRELMDLAQSGSR